ncbi:helix-turn-helix domain-containing protein [Eubacteriales bacterium OttesenSCG-928-A19]|nr:helix-turn-helix domain-containing protein [Eubacteriales bacterium OttesenSCG-928-A19]
MKKAFRSIWKRNNPALGRSVIVSMLISYSAAFLLPLLLAIYTSVTLTDQYNALEKQNRAAALLRMGSVIDANLSNILSGSQLILSDQDVSSLMTAEAPLSRSDLVACWRLKKKLVNQQVINPLVDEIYLYFSYSDSVLCTQGLFQSGRFEGASEAYFDADYPTFLDVTHFNGNYRLAMFPRSDGTNGVAIVRKYYADNRPANAAVVLTINEQAFAQLTESLNANANEPVFLYSTETGQTAFFGSDARTSPDRLLAFAALDERITEYEDEVVVQIDSAYSPGLRYLSLLPASFYNAYFQQQLLRIYLLLGICLLLGIAIILHGIKQQYSPIYAIYRSLQERVTPGEREYRDEYSAIEGSVNRMLTDLESSRQQLTENSMSLRNYVMERIIRGKYASAEDLQRICGQYGLSLRGGDYVVIMVALEDFTPLVRDSDAQDDLSSRQLILEVVDSALGDEIRTAYQFESVVMNEYLCCLIGADGSAIDMPSLRESLLTLVHSLQDQLSISVSIAVGTPRAGVEEIGASWHDASDAMEYMQITSTTGRVLLHGDTDAADGAQKNIDWYHDVDLQKIFFNSMMLGNYQDAYQALSGILRSSLDSSREGILLWQNRRAFIIYIVTDAFDRAALRGIASGELDRLSEATSVSDFDEALRAVFDRATEHAAQEKEHKPSLCDNILAYVEENFASPSISIALIAETFDVSISYVSRHFKSTTGIGLLDYIHMLRIRRAKELLEKTNMNVKDIATEVGYISSLTMSRAFRRYESLTPSEYRDMKRK